MSQLIYIILLIPMLIYGGYFIITGLFAFSKKKKKIGYYDPKHRFAVLIPSRNEEAVIKNLIKSLLDQDYPQALYDTFVIPNNCTDKTEEVAKKAGAKIITCKHKVSTKGEVLKYAFNYFNKNNDYDAFVVFDADNIVAPNFLARMNDALCEGYEVIQGYRDSKNASDNWISGGYSLFYWGQNFFFNRARIQMNSSATLNGTGFVIKKSALKKIGFNMITITEDIEFTINCALNDVKIMFMEDAKTYDEQPLGFVTSWKQRQRWTMGNYQCLANYAGKLLKHAIKKKSITCFDMSISLIAPIIQILGFFLGAFAILYRLSELNLAEIVDYIFSYHTFLILLSYGISILFAVIIAYYSKKKIKPIIGSIVAFPFFILTWLPINIICLFKKNVNWDPIKHSRNIELDSLINK